MQDSPNPEVRDAGSGKMSQPHTTLSKASQLGNKTSTPHIHQLKGHGVQLMPEKALLQTPRLWRSFMVSTKSHGEVPAFNQDWEVVHKC